MILLPLNHATIAQVNAERIDDRRNITYKATCPFCRIEAVIDRDDNAAGCPHAKELQFGHAGSAYFVFERPTT